MGKIFDSNDYFKLTVPAGADPKQWAKDNCDRYGFDFEAWDQAPLAHEATRAGQLIFWPLDDSAFERLREDGVAFEKLSITPKDLYGENWDEG